jgi:hypothetical protein
MRHAIDAPRDRGRVRHKPQCKPNSTAPMAPRDFLQAQVTACSVALTWASERHARTGQPVADFRRTLASPG